MKHPFEPTSVSEYTNPPPQGTDFVGRWLLLARAGWLVVVAVTAVHFFTSLSIMETQFKTVCTNCLLRPSNITELGSLGISADFFATYLTVLAMLFAAMFFVVGATLFRYRSQDRLALLASVTLVALGGTSFGSPVDTLAQIVPAWQVLATADLALARMALVLFIYLFPNGRFQPRWTGGLALAAMVLAGSTALFSTASVSQWLAAAGMLTLTALVLAGACVQLYRYWRISGLVQRQQTRWVVFGIIVALLAQGAELLAVQIIGFHILLLMIGNLVVSLGFLLIPLSLGAAILRYHLFAIDLIFSRTLAYGALTACVVLIYVLAVGSLAALFRTNGQLDNLAISLIATGLVALIFQPLRDWLQRSVNRLLYGQRDEPYVALSQLVSRLDMTFAHEQVLPTVVETIAQSLKLPYAAIILNHREEVITVAIYGAPQGDVVKLPLRYQLESLGELWLCTRAPGESFTSADNRLLNQLARQASAAAHSVRLGMDLQRARERLVAAREEERRLLRRDLHDGLGPSLATLTMYAESAHDLLQSDPTQSQALLEAVIEQAHEAIADVRRVAHQLRPPALDDLGLVGAIRAHTAHYEQAHLRIIVDAPNSLPTLPAAVEVAALRIVQEAMTNVVRHAHASSCIVHLTLQKGALLVEVVDDGQGLRADRTVGVGFSSMRERAEELGGTWQAGKSSTGGVHVRAMLPFTPDWVVGTAGKTENSLEQAE